MTSVRQHVRRRKAPKDLGHYTDYRRGKRTPRAPKPIANHGIRCDRCAVVYYPARRENSFRWEHLCALPWSGKGGKTRSRG